jgi:hypothetical protein
VLVPVPYMLFTKGLKETMKMNVNPDDELLYVYAGINTIKFQM